MNSVRKQSVISTEEQTDVNRTVGQETDKYFG